MGFGKITGVIEVGSSFVLLDYLDELLPDFLGFDRRYGVVDSNGKVIRLKRRLGVYPDGSMVKVAFIESLFLSVKNERKQLEEADGNYWQVPPGYRIVAVPGMLFRNVGGGFDYEYDYSVNAIADEATTAKLRRIIKAYLLSQELFSPHTPLGKPDDKDVLARIKLPNIVLPQK